MAPRPTAPAPPQTRTDLTAAIETAARNATPGVSPAATTESGPNTPDHDDAPAPMPLDATWKILDYRGVDALPFDAVKFMHSPNAKVWKNERSNKQGRKMVEMWLRFRGTQFYVRAGMGVESTIGTKDVRPYSSMPTYGGLTSPAFDTDDTATTEAYMMLRAYLTREAVTWIKERIKAGDKIKGGASSHDTEMPAIPAADLGITF